MHFLFSTGFEISSVVFYNIDSTQIYLREVICNAMSLYHERAIFWWTISAIVVASIAVIVYMATWTLIKSRGIKNYELTNMVWIIITMYYNLHSLQRWVWQTSTNFPNNRTSDHFRYEWMGANSSFCCFTQPFRHIKCVENHGKINGNSFSLKMRSDSVLLL